jgi:hypothetical protein
VVEDEKVKRATQDFREQLKDIDMYWQGGKFAGGGSEQPKEFEELRQRSYRLALALRESIQASWDVELNGAH